MYYFSLLLCLLAMPTTAQWSEKADYLPIDSAIANPERGWYIQEQNSTAASWLNSNRQQNGSTLLRLYVRLDPWKNGGTISDSALQSMRATFATVRENGYKLILRFAYNFGNADDASLETVLDHIRQLRPLLQEEADIISVLEGGFIGHWGEWHSSTNGLSYQWDSPDSLKNYAIAARNQIIDSLLVAVPAPRPLLIRYPKASSELLGGWTPLTASTAWGTTRASRLGHHNDCFLASVDDWGTYTCTDWHSDACWEASPTEMRWLDSSSRWMPIQGETCNLDPVRTACDTALHFLERHHWDALHIGYHEDVIARWRQEGCFSTISRHLGYRFELLHSRITAQAAPGANIHLSLRLRNGGWGKLYNPRPLQLLLRGRHSETEFHLRTGSARADTGLSDLRFWGPGDTLNLAWLATLTPQAPADTYDLVLAIPDAAPSLRDKSRYAVRLDNVGLWDATRGENRLGVQLIVSGPGASPSQPTEFHWLTTDEAVPLGSPKTHPAPAQALSTLESYRLNGQAHTR